MFFLKIFTPEGHYFRLPNRGDFIPTFNTSYHPDLLPLRLPNNRPLSKTASSYVSLTFAFNFVCFVRLRCRGPTTIF